MYIIQVYQKELDLGIGGIPPDLVGSIGPFRNKKIAEDSAKIVESKSPFLITKICEIYSTDGFINRFCIVSIVKQKKEQ